MIKNSIDWLYLVMVIASCPALTFVLFRHSRFECQILSRRTDLGFAVLTGLIVAAIWPLGWLIVLCLTGFGEGIFSERSKH